MGSRSGHGRRRAVKRPDTVGEALRASEELLEAALAGRWQEVERLRPGRDAVLRTALSTDNPDYPYALDMDRVMRLAALDREILAVAEDERHARREQLQQARRGGRARQAFGR